MRLERFKPFKQFKLFSPLAHFKLFIINRIEQYESLNSKKGNELVLIARFLQLLGMLLLIEGLYLGIVKHSMNLEILCVGLGIGSFYAGRWLQGRGS